MKTLFYRAVPAALVLTLSAAAGHAGVVHLHIVDLGIGQHRDYGELDVIVKDGDSPDYIHVHPDLNGIPGAEIVVQMPADSVMDQASADQLRDIIATGLETKINDALANGAGEIEIQLVENMGRLSYLNHGQQQRVAKFGEAAYEAIGDLIAREKNDGSETRADVIAASNGTRMFAESVSRWVGYVGDIIGVVFVDGRAKIDATVDAIRALGPGKMRIFNTHGDIPASSESVGNFAEVVAMMADKSVAGMFSSYLLTPQGHVFVNQKTDLSLLISHILLASNPDWLFGIQQLGPDGKLRDLGGGSGGYIIDNVGVPKGGRNVASMDDLPKRKNHGGNLAGPALTPFPSPRHRRDETKKKKPDNNNPPLFLGSPTPPLADSSDSPSPSPAPQANGSGTPPPPGPAGVTLQTNISDRSFHRATDESLKNAAQDAIKKIGGNQLSAPVDSEENKP